MIATDLCSVARVVALLVLLTAASSCRLGRVNERLTSSCIDRAKVRPDAACAEIYAPVCGCNGQTYPNACMADNAGVTKYVQGPCDTQPGETGKPNPNRQ